MATIMDPTHKKQKEKKTNIDLVTDKSVNDEEETTISETELERKEEYFPLVPEDLLITQQLLEADVCSECDSLRKSMADLKESRLKECETFYVAIRKLEDQLAEVNQRLINEQAESLQNLAAKKYHGSEDELKLVMEQEALKRKHLEDQLENLRFHRSDDAAKYEAQISALQSELMKEQQLKTNTEMLCVSLKQKEEKIVKRTQFYNDLSEGCKKEIMKLQSDLEEKTKALEDLNARYRHDINALNIATQDLMEQNNNSRSETRAAKDALESFKVSSQNEIESLKQEIDSYKRQQEANDQERSQLQQEQMQRLEARLQEKNSDFNACEIKLINVEKELIKERKTNSHYLDEINEAKSSLSKLSYKYNDLKFKANENDRKHKQNQAMFKSFIEGVCGKNAQKIASLYNQFKPLILDVEYPSRADKEALFIKLKKSCEELENDAWFK